MIASNMENINFTQELADSLGLVPDFTLAVDSIVTRSVVLKVRRSLGYVTLSMVLHGVVLSCVVSCLQYSSNCQLWNSARWKDQPRML